MINSLWGLIRRMGLLVGVVVLALFSTIAMVANSWAEESTVQAASSGLLDNGKISLTKLAPTFTRVSGYSGDIWNRTTMIGDAGGTRSDWYDKGVTLDMQVTQVYQEVTSGGAASGNGSAKYNGLMEMNASLDTGKLGWWSGGVLAVTVQNAWGTPLSGEAGNLSLVNMTPMWPEPYRSTTLVTEYYLAQGLPGEMLLIVGRLDATNFLDTNAYANIPEAQFLNGSLNNDLLWGELLTFSTYAALLVVPVSEHFSFATGVWTPETLPDDEGGDWGSYGAVINPIFTYKLGGEKGKAQVTYAYSSAETTAVDNPRLGNPISEFIGDKEGIPSKDDNWLATFNLEQHLWTPQGVDGSYTVPTQDFANNPPGVGLFFRAGFSPEDRNPYNLTMSMGLGARGIIPGRPHDRMGVGAYAMFASDDFKDASFILDEVMDDEVGFEVYYNFAVTPWLQVSADVQWVDPGISTSDGATIVGTRLTIRF